MKIRKVKNFGKRYTDQNSETTWKHIYAKHISGKQRKSTNREKAFLDLLNLKKTLQERSLTKEDSEAIHEDRIFSFM